MGGLSANAAGALAKRVCATSGREWLCQPLGWMELWAGAATVWQIWHSGQLPQWD